jgi:hypothetical protein
MNAQIKDMQFRPVSASQLKLVRSFRQAQQRVNSRKETLYGYALENMQGDRLGFIETTMPHARIDELLMQYCEPPVFFTARQLMRDLLNKEHHLSDIYNCIVRVYYVEDFENV